MRSLRPLLIVLPLGLVASASSASGQELNFRAVAPRRNPAPQATPEIAPVAAHNAAHNAAHDAIAVTVSRPEPLASTFPPPPIYRAQGPESPMPPPPPVFPMLPPAASVTPPAPVVAVFGEPCPTGPRFWGGVDYLYWWLSEATAPPLATSSPSGTQFANAGILGQPGTTTLYAGDIPQNGQSGIRIYFGGWLRPESNVGLGFDAFRLFGSSSNAAFSSSGAPGSPILARPFINANNGLESSQLVAVPGVSTGSIAIHSNTNFWGFELNGLFRPSTESALKFLGGFRYLHLDDTLDVTTLTNTQAPGGGSFIGAPLPAASALYVSDQFSADNAFYGGQAGVSYTLGYGRFSVDLVGKIALGVTNQSISIGGGTSAVIPPNTAQQVIIPGGLLAVRTNAGNLSQNEFGFVPEGRIQANFKVNKYVSLYAGYTIIYWNSVARAAEQIDRTVNPTQVPSNAAFQNAVVGPARPTGVIQTSSMWAQGVNVGVMFTY